MSGDLLIYGSYGYTGDLIAREAVKRGLAPILAGRDKDRLEAQAKEMGLDYQLFDLEEHKLLRANLEHVDVVLHCAGPFSRTSAPMASACLDTGTHYLDLSGELEVFEALAARGAEAARAGVMLLPGVGFDVVPGDCLAACLKARLPSATALVLAVQASVRASRGTAKTALELAGRGGAVRRDGRLLRVPIAHKTRRIDFGAGPVGAVAMPLAELNAAYHSTGIPDIEAYLALPRAAGSLAWAGRYLAGLLCWPPLARTLGRRLETRPAGPGEAARAAGWSRLWGEVTDDAGGRAAARLEAPDVYTLTVHAALLVAQRVLAGEVEPGFRTPAGAYGPELVLQIEGVRLCG